MFKAIDWVILVVLVSLAILVGFVTKVKKWRTKWHERYERKRKLARRIELDPDGELDDFVSLNETTLIGGGGAKAHQVVELTPSSTAATATSTTQQTPAAVNKTTTTTKRPSFLINAISLVIGFQTSTSIVGLPLEFYYYGARSYQFALCMFVAPVLIAFFFVPFLYKIKSASIYEYLEDKFGQSSNQVKKFTLMLSIVFQFIFASLVLFSTAIACMQIVVSDSSSSSSSSSTPTHPRASTSIKVEIWMISLSLGVLSALLALMGLRSVVLANFLQYLIMLGCNLLIIVLGIKNFSSLSDLNETNNANNATNSATSSWSSFGENFKRMWNVTKETGRGEFFVFSENFRTRYTFWNGLIGLLFNVLPSYCLTQQSYMRIKQAKSVRSARLLVLSISPIGFLNLVLILTLGLVMSAYLSRCDDPRTLQSRPGDMAHVNQLFTHFISQFYANYNGLFGLYIALLVSSAIGTLSSVLKALSVVLGEEILRPSTKTLLNGSSGGGGGGEGGGIVAATAMARKSSRTNGVGSIGEIGYLDASPVPLSMAASNEITRNPSFARSQLFKSSTRPPEASDIDNLYEEHLLSIQIGKMPNKRKKRMLQKFLNKKHKSARYLSKKVVSILIVICSMVIILVSIGLNYVPGSLTSVAFSIMNSIHGPVLFIYLCARFNDYSQRRHKYAQHRSTISKLRNFQFAARDVIASCVLSILVVEALFIGRLVSSMQSNAARRFYESDRVANSSAICPAVDSTRSTRQTLIFEYSSLSSLDQTSNDPTRIIPTSTTTTFDNSTLSFLYYFYAISFNWYPFIGFFVCCLTITFFNLTRLFSRLLINVLLAFKCFLKCC